MENDRTLFQLEARESEKFGLIICTPSICRIFRHVIESAHFLYLQLWYQNNYNSKPRTPDIKTLVYSSDQEQSTTSIIIKYTMQCFIS